MCYVYIFKYLYNLHCLSACLSSWTCVTAKHSAMGNTEHNSALTHQHCSFSLFFSFLVFNSTKNAAFQSKPLILVSYSVYGKKWGLFREAFQFPLRPKEKHVISNASTVASYTRKLVTFWHRQGQFWITWCCCSYHKLELKYLESLLSISVTLFYCQTSYCLQGMQQHWCFRARLRRVFCELPHSLCVSSGQPASSEQFKRSSCAGDTSCAGSRTQLPTVRGSSHKWTVNTTLSWSLCNPDKCLAWPQAQGESLCGETLPCPGCKILISSSLLHMSCNFVLQTIRFWCASIEHQNVVDELADSSLFC